MEQSHESPELFKLDEIDRKVFFWLIDHLGTRGLRSWVEYMKQDYKRKDVEIDPDKLLSEGIELVRSKSRVPFPQGGLCIAQEVL